MPWVTFKKLTELLDTIFPPPAAAQFVSNRGARRRAYENLSSLSQQIIDAPPNVRTRLREVLETALSPTAHDGERLCAARAVGRIVNLFHTKARHLEDNDWRHAAACALNTVTPEALGGVSDAWSTLLMLVEFNIDGALLIAVRRMAQFSAIPSRNAAAARRQGAARDRLFTMLARFATVDVATVMPIFGEVVELLIMCRLVPATSYSHVDSVFVAIAPLWRTSGAALQLGSEVIDRLVYEVGAALMRCSKRANGAAQQVADDQFVAAASTFIVLMRSLGGAAFMAEHLPSSTAPIRFISQCLGVAKMLPRAVGNLVFDCLELGFAPTLPSALVVQLCMGATSGVHGDYRHVSNTDRASARQAAVVWLDVVLKCLEYHTPTPEMVDALDVPAMLELRLSTNSDIVTRLLALQAAFFTDARAGATAVRTLARDVRLAHSLAATPLSDDVMPAVRNIDVRHGHYRYLTTRGDARREIVFALRALAQVPASLLHFTSTASDTATLATATASMMQSADDVAATTAADDEDDRLFIARMSAANADADEPDDEAMLNDELDVHDDEVEVNDNDEEDNDDDDDNDDDNDDDDDDENHVDADMRDDERARTTVPNLPAEKPSFLLRPLKVSTSDAPVFTPMAMQAPLTPSSAQLSETECRQRVSMTLRSVLAQLQARLLPSTDAVAAASDVVCVAAARLAEHLLSLSVRPGFADSRITPHATANCSAQLLGALLRSGANVREYALDWFARLLRDAAQRDALLGDVDRVTLLVDALIDCSLSRAVGARRASGALLYDIANADKLTHEVAARVVQCATARTGDSDAEVRDVFVGVLAVLAMTLADAALPSVAQRAGRVAMWRRLLMTVAGDEASEVSPELQLAPVFAPLMAATQRAQRPLNVDWQRVLMRSGALGEVSRLVANVQQATAVSDDGGAGAQQEFVDALVDDDGGALQRPLDVPAAPSSARRTAATTTTSTSATASTSSLAPAARASAVTYGATPGVLSAREVAAARVAGGPSARPQDWLLLADAIECDERLARFGAVCAVARAAVHVQLRTPFGDAQQTLVGLDRTVRAIVPLLCGYAPESAATWPFASSADNSLSSVSDAAFVARAADSTDATLASIVLELCEQLEKQIYHSAHGAVTVSLAPPSAADAFFAANIKTCTDWYARVRPHFMALALAVGARDEVARHGEQRIADLRAQVGGELNADFAARLARADATMVSRWAVQFGVALLQTASAFAERGEPDVIDGYATHAEQLIVACKTQGVTLALPLDELRALHAEAGGATERAAQLYREILANTDAQRAPWRSFCSDRLQFCMVQLGDWRALAALRSSSHGANLDALISDDFVHAMAAYSEGAFPQARERLAAVPINVLAFVDATQQPTLVRSDAMRRRWASERIAMHALLQPTAESSATLRTARSILLPSLQVLNDVSLPTAALHAVALCESAGQHRSSVPDVARRGAAPSLMSGIAWLLMTKADSLVLTACDAARTAGNVQLAERLLTHRFGAAATGELALASARLLHAQGRRLEAIERLCATVDNSSERDARLVAECRLQVGEWLRRERHVADSVVVSALRRRATTNESSPIVKLAIGIDVDEYPGVVEAAAGRQYRWAANEVPSLARAWSLYADWSYRVGHRLVEQLRAVEWLGELSELEGERVAELAARAPAANLAAAAAAISNCVRLCVLDVESDAVRSHDADARRALAEAGVDDAGVLDAVVALCQQRRVRYLSHYAASVLAYFRFLQIGGSSGAGGEVTASLRLLRLLVKYSCDFESLLREGICETPALAWCDVIPQLFARLRSLGGDVTSREQELTRDLLCTALCRVADDHPHAVLFAALVGAKAERIAGAGNVAASSFGRVRQQLALRNARLVHEAETLMHEFERITVLPGERWATSLQRLQGTGDAKLASARGECERLMRAGQPPMAAMRRAHESILAPLAALVSAAVAERLAEARLAAHEGELATVTPADARCERAFVPVLQKLAAQLQLPTDDLLSDESVAWEPVRAALRTASRLSRPGVYELGDVAPVLASMRQLTVAMPGIEQFGGGGAGAMASVTIDSFGTSIDMLASKTRPKKLHVVGSNGRSFVYLLKGREDLRLDERVMQFLRCINQLLVDTQGDAAASAAPLRARHYAVIPLGPRAGLIQWVDGLVPLYSLYKAWQRKQSTELNARPADLFYSKVTPRLRALGLDAATPRSEWPLPMLRDVFDELRRATPSTLLTRELWCASPSPALWLQTRGTYANSCAVMSVAGWLLGLGDRHLDNILLDVRSGELLHIDYNVCFERGLKLRIAERVPFRMTQNMVAALGPCGVEGQFRRTCERVMTTLGASRELLLTLLEAFIYDPLAEWTGESDAADLGHTRQELQLALALVTERADELRALAERDADDAQVAELARGLRSVLLTVIPAVVQRSLHAPQLFRHTTRADELAAAEQHLHMQLERERQYVEQAMQRFATAESALQAERDEAAVLSRDCAAIAAANNALTDLLRSPTTLESTLAAFSDAIAAAQDASDVPPLRDAARLLEGPPSPQQARREQSDRELLRGCAEVDQQLTAVLREIAQTMGSAVSVVRAYGDALARVPLADVRLSATTRAVSALASCAAAESASDLSSDDESEGEQLKRAVTFADKRERMAVARAERDLLRLSSRRERLATDLVEQLNTACTASKLHVTIVDDAQAELGRATQRLADSRAALANASGSSALSLLSASVAPPLARVSDALRRVRLDDGAAVSIEQGVARERLWRDAVHGARLLTALLEQLVLDVSSGTDELVAVPFATAGGMSVATFLSSAVQHLNGAVHIVDEIDTSRAQLASVVLPRLVTALLPGASAESSADAVAVRASLAAAQELRKQLASDDDARTQLRALLAPASGAGASLWAQLCAVFSLNVDKLALDSSMTDERDRVLLEHAVDAMATMIETCTRAATVPAPDTSASATAAAASMPRILSASDMAQSPIALAWSELSSTRTAGALPPSPLDTLIAWQDECVRRLLVPSAARTVERCVGWLLEHPVGIDPVVLRRTFAARLAAPESEEALVRLVQRMLHSVAAADAPALTVSLGEALTTVAADSAPLVLYRALTQRVLEARAALSIRTAVTFALAWRADGAVRMCRQIDDAARNKKAQAPASAATQWPTAKDEFDHELEQLRQRDSVRTGLLESVQALGDPTRAVSMAARLQAQSRLHTRLTRAAAACVESEATLRVRIEQRAPQVLAVFDARVERRRARLARLMEAYVELATVLHGLVRVERQAPFVADATLGGGGQASASSNYALLIAFVAQVGTRVHTAWAAARDAHRTAAAGRAAVEATLQQLEKARVDVATARSVVAEKAPLVAVANSVLAEHSAALVDLDARVTAACERVAVIEREFSPPFATVAAHARRLPRRGFGALYGAFSTVLERVRLSLAAAQRLRATLAAVRSSEANSGAMAADVTSVAADIDLISRLYGSSLRAEVASAIDAGRAVQESGALASAAADTGADDVDEGGGDEQQPTGNQPQQQQRNARAVAIVKRIKAKLEAREQVASIIEQATNGDNLAQMFEGWSAWY